MTQAYETYQIRFTGTQGVVTDEKDNKVPLVIDATNNTLIFNGIDGFSKNINSAVIFVNEA
ncbi:hypothetical protein [Vibrio cholerae]|uniref:hypothetical protein n=1 Tax=Vibrio cholerae TaxID=666 RepID=UPI001C2F8372